MIWGMQFSRLDFIKKMMKLKNLFHLKEIYGQKKESLEIEFYIFRMRKTKI